MGDITANFSRHEFDLPAAKAAEYGFPETVYPAEWIETRLRPLCGALEKVRARLGAPITIISGYRPPSYDAARIAAGRKGVSPRSQHGEGRAADFVVKGYSPEKVLAVVMDLYETGEISIGGVGIYDGWIHLDVRPGPLRRWDERSK